MKRFKKFSLLIIPGLLLLLGGCGGSGGSTDLSGTLALTVSPPAAAGVPGTATASYTAFDGRDPQGVKINFSTDRPDIVQLSATQAIVGSDGTAMVPFTTIAVPADATAVIYAKTGGLSQFQTITITGTPNAPPPLPPVPPTAASITFVTASPTSIALKGMGGAGSSETSDVSFQVRDANNIGVPNVVVDFSLNTSIGGITIAPGFGTTDSSGRVQTKVSSGIIATPVKVTATVRSTTLSAQSSQLVVQSGLPDQDSLSVSFSNLNSESYNVDGVSVTATARLADHFNNPAPDGTAVYFTTEGGAIDPSCTTVNGACTVTWRSQNPRPTNGRVTVLAYTVGEESFLDTNGNGLADAGACSPILIPGIGQANKCDEFYDTPEAYRDDNESGVRDAAETFIDFNQDGSFNTPDTVFNGVLRPSSVSGPTTKHIFYNSVIIMATGAASITTSPASLLAPGALAITVRDLNGNTMPSGTTITITAPSFGKMTGTTSYTVPQNIGNGVTLNVYLAAGDTPKAQAGTIEVKVASPGGLVTNYSIFVSGNF